MQDHIDHTNTTIHPIYSRNPNLIQSIDDQGHVPTTPAAPLPKIRPFDGHDWFLTKTTYRNLPHWELRGSTYFITINVHPDAGRPFFDHNVARIMLVALNKGNKVTYDLQAFVIMPNHVHLIIKPFPDNKLSEILKQLKGSTSFQINKLLNRTGKFWQAENFDHLIRHELGLREKWEYVKQNPVKAKLVNRAEDYPYSSFYGKS